MSCHFIYSRLCCLTISALSCLCLVLFLFVRVEPLSPKTAEKSLFNIKFNWFGRYYCILCCVVLCFVVLFCLVLAYLALTCLALSCLVFGLACRAVLCLVLSCFVLSSLLFSSLVLSCLALSYICLVLSLSYISLPPSLTSPVGPVTNLPNPNAVMMSLQARPLWNRNTFR